MIAVPAVTVSEDEEILNAGAIGLTVIVNVRVALGEVALVPVTV